MDSLLDPPAAGAEWWKTGTSQRLTAERWTEHGFPITGTQGAVDWEWASGPPPACRLPNHGSARANADALGDQLDQLLSVGIVEQCPVHVDEREFAVCINPLAAVPKADGTQRVILDPSATGVNAAMSKLSFKLPTPEYAMSFVGKHSVLGKRDLKNGFWHVSLSSESRRYMGFTHPVSGKVCRWVALPFGAAQSPFLFCQISDAAAQNFQPAVPGEGHSCVYARLRG